MNGPETRVLLLNAPYHGRYYLTEIPTGLGYLAENLMLNGIDCRVLDMNLDHTVDDLKGVLDEYRPTILGFSQFTLGYRNSYGLLRAAKEQLPELKIILGGPHLSLFKEKVLEECADVDIGVIGEGELRFPQICKGEPLETIPGVIYRENSEIRVTEQSPFLTELDEVPFPRYEQFDLEAYARKTMNKRINMPIVTSRGCPYGCTFCAARSVMGRQFRMRSAESVVEELQHWYDKGIRDFCIVDDNFTFDQPRVFEICDLIEERGLTGLRFSCDNGVRADRTTREMLERMRRVGFWRVCLGVEVGNDKMLKIIRKGEKMEAIETCIENACETGFEVVLFFIIGTPGETMDDVRDSAALALRYPVMGVQFYNIVPYPGTVMYEQLRETGKILVEPEVYLNQDPRLLQKPLFETAEMDMETRKKAMKLVGRVRSKVFRKSMERRLARLGILGKLFARVYGIDAVRDRLLHSTLLRKLIIEPVKHKTGYAA